MKKPVLFALVALALVSLACKTLLPDAETAQPDNVLFQDDFSDTSSGWSRYNESDGLTDYQDGGYRIFVNAESYSFWSNPGLGESLPADLRVEVDATKIGGPDENDFGVICRYVEGESNSSFYQFMVTSDGYYGIVRVDDNVQTVITQDGKLMPTDLVKTGEATNRVGATCIGSTLTLYVNGSMVASVEDSTLTSGDVGLFVGSFESIGADIMFDNFIVTKP